MSTLRTIWQGYSRETRNIVIYLGGIMFYKLGIEFFNGSITTLAQRFDPENHGLRSGQVFDSDAKPLTKMAGAQGLSQAAQCVGAILIAPLVKRWPISKVLSAAIGMFSLTAAILLIVDAGTGGKFREGKGEESRYGNWSPYLLFLFWPVSGVCYGMVELIRRVIPADIVGGNVNKLRRMDAIVHIFYGSFILERKQSILKNVTEVAGTAGAIASALAISRWGDNKSFLLTPVFFVLAGLIWASISTNREPAVSEGVQAAPLSEVDRCEEPTNNYFTMVGRGFRSFGDSVLLGAKLVFTRRCFIWLIPSYSVALYLHRFLENTLAPAFSRRVLFVPEWSQIIVGGSNLGELLGALLVLLFSDYVHTPLPWLRLDALALNIVWVLPAFAQVNASNRVNKVSWAWKVFGCFIPISMGWAAGDISLAAYIQSVLSESGFQDERVSALGAVMACLYTAYIALYAILSVVLADVIDRDWSANNSIVHSLKTVGGVHFTVSCGVILLSTLVPKRARSWNPDDLGRITTGRTPNQSESELDIMKGPNKIAELRQDGLSIHRGYP